MLEQFKARCEEVGVQNYIFPGYKKRLTINAYIVLDREYEEHTIHFYNLFNKICNKLEIPQEKYIKILDTLPDVEMFFVDENTSNWRYIGAVVVVFKNLEELRLLMTDEQIEEKLIQQIKGGKHGG